MTALMSGLSIPMPKALVATMSRTSAIHEGILGDGAIARAHPAVIRDRRDALLTQERVNLLDVLHRRRVDDGGTIQFTNELHQLPLLVGVAGDGTHEVRQVGAMRAGVHDVQRSQVQLLGRCRR